MAPIRASTGRIVDLHRYLTRMPRLTDHDPCRERWELWIATPAGHEQKFIAYSRTMPARVAHSAQVLHIGSTAVGLYNLTTGDRVNFARADPALLVRRIDGAVVVLGCLVGIAIGAAVGPLWSIVAGALLVFYLPVVVVCRWLVRTALQISVARRLHVMEQEHVVRPLRRPR